MHDVDELGPHLSDFLEGFGVDEVLLGPLRIVLMHLPLLVDVQEGEMVTLRDLEMFSCGIALLFSVLRAEEN